MKFKDLLKNAGVRLLDKVLAPFSTPMGVFRPLDPCPCGRREPNGAPRTFFGCHLRIADAVPEDDMWLRKKFAPNKDLPALDRNSPQYFTLKGKRGEEYVRGLAEGSFFSHWCYPNVKLPNGKELCDLLVVFGEVAIVFQIKDAEVDDETGGYKESDVKKNHDQLGGAYRSLTELHPTLRLTNPDRGDEVLDTKSIKRIHLVSVLRGKAQGFLPSVDERKGKIINVFCGDFPDTLFGELDTITDFLRYVDCRERLFAPGAATVICEGSEENLLAAYLAQGRSFDKFAAGTAYRLSNKLWDKYVKSESYRDWSDERVVAKIWDEIIEQMRGARVSKAGASYEPVGRIMAATGREMRAYLSRAYLRAIGKLIDAPSEGMVIRYINDRQGGVTYCFALSDDSETMKESLEEMLGYASTSARYKYPANSRVITVSRVMSKTAPSAMEVSMFDQPELDPKEQEMLKECEKAGFGNGGEEFRMQEPTAADEDGIAKR